MNAGLDEGQVRLALGRVWPDAATIDGVELRPLDGGINARSFLVTAGARRYVLRLPVPGAPALLDFATEVRAMRAAAAAGLAPNIVNADIDAGLLLTAYRAQPWTATVARTPLGIARLAATLRSLHAVPIELPVFDATGIAQDYLQALDGRGALPARERAWSDELLALAAWFAGYVPTAFCHNDLVAANVLDDGVRLLLVDFEYAVRSAPLLDLANVAGMNDYTSAQCRALLAAYCDGGMAAVAPTELDDAVRMVRLLAFFWARVGVRRAAGTEVYEKLAARLESTL